MNTVERIYDLIDKEFGCVLSLNGGIVHLYGVFRFYYSFGTYYHYLTFKMNFESDKLMIKTPDGFKELDRYNESINYLWKQLEWD